MRCRLEEVRPIAGLYPAVGEQAPERPQRPAAGTHAPAIRIGVDPEVNLAG